jgi:tetratricopeptide (TPR) repeat protein
MFLDSLLTFASAPGPCARLGVRLIYALRADFIHRLLAHRRFTDAIQGADVKVGPMHREELDCVIRQPALFYGVQFEEGLAERILNDAGKEPGSLPLLQFTLAELWERQTGRALAHTAYEQIGQLSGAIANRAETVYRSLTPRQQEAAQHILTRLVRLADEGGEDTRHRVHVAALYGQEQLNTDAGRTALEVLTHARLITLGLGDDLRQETVEIAHEALIRRWPRLSQWLHEHREILIWRQRLRLIMHEWQKAGRDDGFLLRGPLLDEARLWISHRANDLTRTEKDFINSSIAFHKKERCNRPIASLELLMANLRSEADGLDEQRAGTGREGSPVLQKLPFLRQPGSWRVQINIIPVTSGNVHSLRSQLPQLPIADLVSLFSAAARVKIPNRDTSVFHDDLESTQKFDDETFVLLRRLQLMGASGLALELVTPELDGIRDPHLRLKFASIVFDMMHIRGRYEDAAELIQQELALHGETTRPHSRLLLPLKIRLLHHRMFYQPVSALWAEMLDLLAASDPEEDAGSHGEILFMLGGNLGTLRGDYRIVRPFLLRAIRYARKHNDEYLLARCLRKYGDYLRYRGHLRLANSVLSEYFETALDLANAAYIPGWLGNLHLGLAEIAIERNVLDEARAVLDQAEAHYRKTRPKHWWGEIQISLGRCRIMNAAGEPGWFEVAHAAQCEAIAAGYERDADFASRLLAGELRTSNVLMFL